MEDGAKAHGAQWRDRPAGSMGVLGTFSMQQTKVLTSGEGGSVVTDDEDLYGRACQLRCDGRSYSRSAVPLGHVDQVDMGDVLGTNYCLSEFHAAVLLEQMDRLDEQIRTRHEHGRLLSAELEHIAGVDTLRAPDAVTLRGYYEFVIKFDPSEFANRSPQAMCNALEAEIGFPPELADNAFPWNRLYKPLSKRRYRWCAQWQELLDPRRFELPIAAAVQRHSILLLHWILLAAPEQLMAIADAMDKLRRHASEIPEVA